MHPTQLQIALPFITHTERQFYTLVDSSSEVWELPTRFQIDWDNVPYPQISTWQSNTVNSEDMVNINQHCSIMIPRGKVFGSDFGVC